MTICGCFTIDGPQQIEVFDNSGRAQIKDVFDDILHLLLGDNAGSHEIDHNGDRFGNTDGIGDLNFTFFRQSGGNDVFGDMPTHVGSAPVYFGGILAGKASVITSYSIHYTKLYEDVSYEDLREAVIEEVIKKTIPAELRDGDTRYFINPTGKFVVGGPMGDCGVTGRKIIVDTYGGQGIV